MYQTGSIFRAIKVVPSEINTEKSGAVGIEIIRVKIHCRLKITAKVFSRSFSAD